MSTGLFSSRRNLYTAELLGRLALGFFTYSLLPIVFFSDVQHYFEVARHIGFDELPYRDFAWEFPPLTALTLPLVPLSFRSSFGFHVLFVALMVVFEWLCLYFVRRHDEQNFRSITLYWTAVIVPFSMLAWNRLDYLSVLLFTLGLIAVVRNRPVAGWIVLGFLAKLWPVLLAAGLLSRRRFAELALAIVGVGVATVGWYAFSPSGFENFLEYRKGQGFQVESLPGALLHFFGREWFFYSGTVSISDDGWEWLQPTMVISTVVGIAALAFVGLLRKHHDVVLLVGACVAVSIVFSRLISPQFLVWLAPVVALRLGTHRHIAVLYATTLALSFLVLLFYEQMVHTTGTPIIGVLVVRDFLLVALMIAMIRGAFVVRDVGNDNSNGRTPERSTSAEQTGAQTPAV